MDRERVDEAIYRWETARMRLERANADVRRASAELDREADQVARWLVPDGAMPGDRFYFWVEFDGEDKLIYVEVGEDKFKVWWRRTMQKAVADG